MKKFLDQDGLVTLWNKIKSVFAKKSDLDGKADVGDLGEQIIPLEDNGTTTAGVWLAKNDKVTEYVDGALYLYKITVKGASTTTLNINGLGAKTIALQGSTNLTTHYGVGNWLLFVYREANETFIPVNNYYSDSNNIPGVYCSTTASAAAKVGALSTYDPNVKAAIDGGPMYLTVCMYYSNTKAAALTLNVDGSGAHPIYINGEPSSATNHTLPAGMYFVYWDGEHYQFRTDGKLTINGVVFGGSYNDLTDKPTIPAVPSNVSAFQNDAGYLVASDIANKVDKVDGKGLSTNDYTTDEKNKLAGIASGATANAGTITGVSLNGTSVATSGVANLKNIPTKIIINSGQKAIDQNGIVDLGTYLTEHQSLTHLAPIASPEFTGTPTAPTPTSTSGATQIATKGYVDTAVAGASGGGSGSGKVYLGKCLTAAGMAAKVGTIDGTFTLEVGCIVGLFSTITNTASNPTLNVANTGAYHIWYGNAKLTTSTVYRAQQANFTTFFVFTGEYWHFLSQGADLNTTYGEITLANLNSSTSSTAGLITGRRLQAALAAWKTSEGLATESYVDTAIANAGTVTGVSQADLNTQLPPVGVAGTVKCIYKNTGNAAASIEILPQNSAAAVEYLSVDGEQVPRTLLDAGVMSRTLNPNETIEVEFVFAPVAGLPWRNSVVPQGVIGASNIIQTLVLPASVVVVEDRQGFDQLSDVWCLGPQPPHFGDLADIRANVHAPRIFASMYTSEYVTNGGYPVTIISY